MTSIVRSLPRPAFFGGRRAGRLIERNLFVYRQQWIVFLSGFFEPLFYLFGLGFGVGALVGEVPGPSGEPIPYALFVAPALLASSAMNGAIFEATYNFFFKLRWQGTYEAILATPLSLGDIALGELVWSAVRAALYCVGFLIVITVLGMVASPLALLALPAALLLAFSVGALAMAGTTFLRYWTDLDLITIILLPVFLFSGTFYPISVYPPVLQAIVWVSPLFHGTEIIRALMLGAIEPVILVHVAILVAYTLVGFWICARRLDILLVK